MRYQIRAVADPEMSAKETLRGEVLAETDDRDEAKRMAVDLSAGLPWGTAIIDTMEQRIDWGDHVTDFSGREIPV